MSPNSLFRGSYFTGSLTGAPMVAANSPANSDLFVNDLAENPYA